MTREHLLQEKTSNRAAIRCGGTCCIWRDDPRERRIGRPSRSSRLLPGARPDVRWDRHRRPRAPQAVLRTVEEKARPEKALLVYFPVLVLMSDGIDIVDPDWVCRPTFSRSADQSQSPRDARCRLSGDRRPVQGRQSRCRDPRSQLPSLPPECQPSRANAGGERYLHRYHGLRQRYRRVCRRAALSVL